MKVVAFGASNSKDSINKKLATYAGSLIENADLEVLDLNDFEMPIYSEEREQSEGIPQKAKDFSRKFQDADLVIASFAEHNGNFTAAFKNILDWSSRDQREVFQNTPMLVLSSSPGPNGASSVLEIAKNSLGFFGAEVKAGFSLPNFYEHYSDSGFDFKDPNLLNELKSLVKDI